MTNCRTTSSGRSAFGHEQPKYEEVQTAVQARSTTLPLMNSNYAAFRTIQRYSEVCAWWPTQVPAWQYVLRSRKSSCNQDRQPCVDATGFGNRPS